MNKRTFYVIRDYISGKYANDKREPCPGGAFDSAVMHTSLDSVRKGVRDRVKSIKRWCEQKPWVGKDAINKCWLKDKPYYVARETLFDGGMEIVELTLAESGPIIPLKK